MSTLHEFDATSMSRDCTCGWVAEARWTVDEARAAWREHINDSRHQPALDRASIPAMNITNAVPPICTKHHETMVLSFYDRPGSPPGNGYSCRSCTKERQTAAQGLSVDYDPSKSRLQSAAPEPKMQRALAEGEFNVVGDELRKLNEKMDGLDLRMAAKVYVELGVKVLQERLDNAHEDINSRSVDFEHNLSNHLKAMEERMQAQLTALRAEADKGREQLGEFVNKIASSFEGMLLGVQAQVLNAQQPARARKKKQECKRGRK